MAEESVQSRLGLKPGTPPLVALRGVAKYFPGVIANEDVNLAIYPGEIHALLGENGAGKSTLMNILTGIYQADAGEIVVDGETMAFASPVEAIAAGIGMVHQHFKLVQAFTVAENVHLGWSQTPARISARDLEARTLKLSQDLGLAVTPGARVSDLSTGEQQRVEILRVLSRDARVLILDEPTAVLTPAEAQELFVALRAFTARGNAVIFISHKLDEVMEIANRVTILRGGRKVATEWTENCSEKGLAQMMVGREIVLNTLRGRPEGAGIGAPVLELRDVSLNAGDLSLLKNINLTLHAGEVLGIAGVAGNGQRELSHLLTGMSTPSEGAVLLEGQDVSRSGARAMAQAGVGHIPEDRLHAGMAPALPITDNAVLREYDRAPLAKGPWYLPRQAFHLAREIAKIAEVAVPDFAMPARNLSGGNQQRLVARREMRIADKVLIAAYPSRGLDVGAINTMMRYFVELRDSGVAVVLISEELEELMNLADRIAVMFHGEIMGILPAEGVDIDEIGLMMGGRRAA
ncbi:ABC transporter ATP-binding protein [Pseudooceanicola sp. CBS1P-1]|uniref:ATP-binding cassette domain-containing protein n=1 Tax=Pseudooceanicola albus TaxID=2692189 RepID=A0A6L7G326_9RHOB|nr:MULTISPECIES: ABC transporter ATP-binding protein [Pseudooceanicola]MBT9385173.1 ABC transporter ATP-binding protein [Pseudooceanicola endophyticus]MXN18535.1 ATP-binding cassette domain-containing protein [Pseudooceanicola albus]